MSYGEIWRARLLQPSHLIRAKMSLFSPASYWYQSIRIAASAIPLCPTPPPRGTSMEQPPFNACYEGNRFVLTPG